MTFEALDIVTPDNVLDLDSTLKNKTGQRVMIQTRGCGCCSLWEPGTSVNLCTYLEQLRAEVRKVEEALTLICNKGETDPALKAKIVEVYG